MLITGIRSKPVYTPLAADLGGRFHLMIGFGVGSSPLLRVVDELRAAAPAALPHTRVLYVQDPANEAVDLGRFTALAAAVQVFADTEALLAALEPALERSLMGTRLYVAGPESFMGRIMRLAARFNLNRDEVRAEECGSLARRVWCVHCGTTLENVRTNIVECGCRRWLIVRDHYSRRYAAYMGVMVDAEAPGERPEIREVFV